MVINYTLSGKGLDVIKMVVEDSGNRDIGSYQNLIWGEVVWWMREVEVRKEQYKWSVDSMLGWGTTRSSLGRVHRVGERDESDW